MNSRFVKRSLRIRDCDVRICIEHPFWTSFEDIAQAQATTASELAALIAVASASVGSVGLSSAIRAYVIDYFRMQLRKEQELQAAPYYAAPLSATGDGICGLRPRWLN
jgi:predicted DNA-binding ribbon-helix-helix protein